MKAPQIIYLTITLISLLATAYLHGKPQSNYNIRTTLIGTAITIGLLVWGGFFS